MIHWELCKKLKFDHINQWYTHGGLCYQLPASDYVAGIRFGWVFCQKCVRNSSFWDFEIQTDHLARQPDLVIVKIKKLRTCRIVDFAIPAEYRVKLKEGCPHDVMVKAMDCGIVISEFVLQSRYYIHFRANTLGKGMNPLILPAMG